MNRTRLFQVLPMAAVFTVSLAIRPASAGAITFTGSGATIASIASVVDGYRTALGTLNPNNLSSFATGRREINWDGVPDAMADPNFMPGDFFASTTVAGRSRGLVVSTPGAGFLVSSTAGSVDFGFPGDFAPFSNPRLFTPVGINITDVNFFVPGTTTPATVSGFGSIFSDVEIANVTRLDFFDVNNTLLVQRFVEPSVNLGFSFLGVQFNAGERIGRVRITTGSSPLFSNGSAGPLDVVVMDDFIYAEPQAAVPEPTSLTLLGTGALFLVRRVKGRRHTTGGTRQI